MRLIKKWMLVPVLCLVKAPSLYADDLLSVYELARQSDPQLQAAIAAHSAALEIVPQSKAVLLPDLSLAGDYTWNRFHDRKPDAGEKKNTHSTNQVYAARLRQSVYHRDRFIQLAQADNRVAQADAELVAARQDLILRTATRYFLVLGAMDNLEFVRADKDAIARTLEQAKQRFEVGLTAITDVYEAQARYDVAVSEEINAEKLLDDTREALRELTGEIPGDLEVLKEEIPLVPPEPADKEQWVSTAVEQNPLLLASRAATEVARQEIQVQRSGHYPSMDVVADYSRKNIQFGGVVPQERNDSAIGIEFSMPLYQGGLVSSQTRQARDLFTQAQEEQVQQRRDVERQARDNYRGVQAEISKVKALKQAVLSSEKALEASEAGFEVGTRTIVDVLDSQRELLRARRDHARSRYDYLLDTLGLKQAAGIVEASDLARINDMLEVPRKTESGE
ncbi:MAG: TolC family outer membrane protein [Gammaproteobacteria bacterium]|nr:MAG: TolC family outer membrane protein [Gammaproteobacteria bacterium]